MDYASYLSVNYPWRRGGKPLVMGRNGARSCFWREVPYSFECSNQWMVDWVFRKIEWAEEAGCDIESGGNGPGGQWFGLYTGKGGIRREENTRVENIPWSIPKVIYDGE